MRSVCVIFVIIVINDRTIAIIMLLFEVKIFIIIVQRTNRNKRAINDRIDDCTDIEETENYRRKQLQVEETKEENTIIQAHF